MCKLLPFPQQSQMRLLQSIGACVTRADSQRGVSLRQTLGHNLPRIQHRSLAETSARLAIQWTRDWFRYSRLRSASGLVVWLQRRLQNRCVVYRARCPVTVPPLEKPFGHHNGVARADNVGELHLDLHRLTLFDSNNL